MALATDAGDGWYQLWDADRLANLPIRFWAFDPRELWPAAEASEKRKDATVAREFEIALPHEMTDEERSALTADIARALVERYRFAIQATNAAIAEGLRFKRRLQGEDRAKHLLHQAEYALEQFEGEHPKPGYWSRAEWTKRRARRLRAVQSRRDACRRAHLATEPDAQRDYEAKARVSAEQLEALSRRMLARYPVPADQQVPAPPEKVTEEAQSDEARPGMAKPRLT